MTKREYIKSKWIEAGFVWDEIDSVVNDSGGLGLKHPSLKTSLTGYSSASHKGLLRGYGFNGESLMIWNNLLNGIESNNGWAKIESENDLPKTHGWFLFITKETGKQEKNEWRGLFQKQIIEHYSHWMPIIEIPNPLY